MTIKNLIKILEKYPPHFEVMIHEEGGNFSHHQIDCVVKEKIFMRDGDGGKVLSKKTVVTIKPFVCS